MKRHLGSEMYARRRADGAGATLKWALTNPPPEFREKLIGDILSFEASSDGLRPVLLALQQHAETPSPELLDQALAISEKADLQTDTKTIEEVSRLAQGNAKVIKILDRFQQE